MSICVPKLFETIAIAKSDNLLVSSSNRVYMRTR